ncbi:hypothetical protein HPO96_10320 [Kribbella sandramycini]|uniref:Uncharacterized protein n=1 Tax=Kribbella sandramycini TaxID=60450 RepID=A0A7Y4P034_9ACTN|nr:hypothetical protein [Kribbella sandramycini]MBB6569527.1 hypothetical protein [Kribbella sandramycini]NOL40639.1 hypothetical protein [Kribbella sandramycini]
MSDEQYGADLSQQTQPPPPPSAVQPAADPAIEAARARLAEWLTAQSPDDPEYAATPEDLAGWDARPQDEFLLFVPPGYANQIYLVADRGISVFAPSQTTLEDAIAAARA